MTELWSPQTQATEQLGWAYAYDDNGTLLGEYGMGGAASSGSTQHIYLPTASGLPLPVAAIINGQHFAVHTDHLNTPRRLTRKNGQVAWQWAFSAFGETEPTTADKRFTSASTNPATGTTTAGAVTYNLRYPGQVFDKESGLHYNYYRTYDPKTGRYTQADPIGLDGGWNRYGYVGGDPLGAVDPRGLNPLAGAIGGAEIGTVIWPGVGTVVGGVAGGIVGWWVLDKVTDSIMEMAAPGNVADTQISQDYEKYASNERLCGRVPISRCSWLAQNQGNYRPDQVKATEKAWGCRGSRWGKGGSLR